MGEIDFVLTWVDGNDPAWIKERNKFLGLADNETSSEEANSDCRYRADHDLLRFWFRSVEQYAPWVHRIHFITCGQTPDWLNESHPKLNMINHTDYIPSKYLPTFNSNTIELNYYRIDQLAERFVLFNDDIFLLRPIEASYFFKDGFPVLINDLRYHEKVGYNNWSRIVFNDYCLVNNSFDISKSIWGNRRKWFNPSVLGYKRARKNFICFLANRTLPVSTFGHIASPHLKSTFVEMWARWPDALNVTCSHRFRTDDQVNQWLAIAWNLAKGTFSPTHEKGRGKVLNISPRNIAEIEKSIKEQTYPQICINDSPFNSEPEKCNKRIMRAFNEILPKKSEFEKF